MITSFQVENSAIIKRMFKFEMEYIDMMVTSVGVGLISNTSEMFIQKFFPSLVPEHHEKDICFRVSRASFLSLLGDGVVELNINDFGDVKMTFTGKDTPTRKMSFKQQASDLSQIVAKLSIFQHKERFVRDDMNGLRNHLGWYKNASKTVQVKDGLLIYQSPDRRIYQKVKCPDLAASVAYMRFILDHTEEQYFFQNYIIGTADNLYVILKQQNYNVHNELDLINSLPSSHKIEVLLTDVYKLLKMIPKPEEVVIDFEEKEAIIIAGKDRISTGIEIKNVTSVAAKNRKVSTPVDSLPSLDDLFTGKIDAVATLSTKSEHNMPKIALDSDILLSIIGAKSERAIVFSVKKNLVQITLKSGLDIIVSKRVS